MPKPGSGELLLEVKACAVCRTDLHIVDGELANPSLPLIPGHQVVGVIREIGEGCRNWEVGQRVGVAWLGWACGKCEFCSTGRENLCERARFTGYTLPGGYAEFTKAFASFCFSIPERYADHAAAPLLCAGLIGYRSYRKTGSAHRIGLYGFGSAAHILTQVAVAEGREIFAFTRAGDRKGQDFARSLGAAWAGDAIGVAPEPLDAAIIFAPAGELLPVALGALRKGGTVVCGGIHMSDIPSFPYELLWHERTICSVANLTRRDGNEFFELAAKLPIHCSVHRFPFSAANEALNALRSGSIKGTAVLVPSGGTPPS